MAKTNRRKHPRVEGEGITGHVKHEGDLLLAMPIENISLGGMLLRCERALPVGNQVFLEVARPGMKSLKLVGRVLSVVPLKKKKGIEGTYGLSIRFNPMGEEATTRLQDLVTSLYFGGKPIPTAQPSPVRVALQQAPAPRPFNPDFDFDYAARSGALAEESSEAVTGQAASAGAQFDPNADRGGFDFDFKEPLAGGVHDPVVNQFQNPVTVSLGGEAPEPEPVAAPEPEAIPVPPAAKLTAQVRFEEATLEQLRDMLEERDKEIRQLKDELLRKNTEVAKLRRAVVELRHRNKPVL
jgi:hypothetical protein